MTDRLVAKAERYERLLADALSEAEVAAPEEGDRDLAEEHIEMAAAYLKDGRHFRSNEDHENALAAFSYGHGWLDAAIRAELVDPGNAVAAAGPRGV